MKKLFYAISVLLLTAVLTFGTSLRAEGQSYSHTGRAFVQDPSALARGDVGVAMPGPFMGHFYNPAHTPAGTAQGLSVQVFGVNAAMSTNALRQWSAFQEDVRPVMNRGFDNLTLDEQAEVLQSVSRRHREPTVLSAGAMLPAAVVKTGSFAVSGGVFTHSVARYQITNGGADMPFVSALAHVDLVGIASVAGEMEPVKGHPLALGATMKHTQRYASSKNKALDAFSTSEDIYLISGSSASIDLGALYEVPVRAPGTLMAGVALLDVISTDFDFELSRTLYGREKPLVRQVARETEYVSRYLESSLSYRAGLAYMIGAPADPAVGIGLDYLGYSDPIVRQSALAHVRLGMHARMHPNLRVQGGLNQGYPSGGLNITLGPARLSYAYYGVEEGRIPGQLARWNHAAQVALVW